PAPAGGASEPAATCDELRNPDTRTEAAVSRIPVQSHKLRPAHVYEGRVIACLEIDVGLFSKAVVHHDVEPIALADGRDGTTRAIAEQLIELELSGEDEVLTEPTLQVRPVDAI